MFFLSLKRVLDVLLAGVGLILLSPVLIAISGGLWLTIGSPVFFSQTRPGLNGKLFKMRKFRSMSNAKGVNGELLPDAQRITRLGKVLRSTSLDELPELWNVLVGDMSLVGPRPLLVEYLPLYTSRQSRRHDVRPGVTGWAQVNGRNSLSWEKKFELDVWYVENKSMRLDMKILLLTLKKVWEREGISAAGDVTMPKFTGSIGPRDGRL